MSRQKMYYALWFVVGALFGALLAGAAVLGYIVSTGRPMSDNWMALVGFIFTALGLVLGFLLGPIAWRKVYVEGVRGSKYVIKGE